MEIKSLALLITTVCNLSCRQCCQGMPILMLDGGGHLHHMSVWEFQTAARACAGLHFKRLAISGGEPTLCPNFHTFCGELRKAFWADSYELVTNGCWLERQWEAAQVFDKITISEYPELRNINHWLRSLDGRDARISIKDHSRMVDMSKPHPANQAGHPWLRCWRYGYVNIVASRVYPCCGMFGQMVMRKLDVNYVSVPVELGWEVKLERLQLEYACRQCAWNSNEKP